MDCGRAETDNARHAVPVAVISTCYRCPEC